MQQNKTNSINFSKYFLPPIHQTNEKVGIYYINLDCATERKKNIEYHFGTTAKRIPAISAKEIQETSYLCKSPQNGSEYIQCDFGFYPSYTGKKYGEIACIFSHLEAIKKAYYDDCDFAYIIEDDIDFSIIDLNSNRIIDGFFYFLKQIDANNNQNEKTDIYQYYTNNINQLQKNASNNQTNNLWENWEQNNWGTCIYGITKLGMQKILNYYHLQIELYDIGGFDLTRFPYDLKEFVADILIYKLETDTVQNKIISKTLKYPFLCDTATDSYIHPEHVSKIHKPSHNWVYLNSENIYKVLYHCYPNLFC